MTMITRIQHGFLQPSTCIDPTCPVPQGGVTRAVEHRPGLLRCIRYPSPSSATFDSQSAWHVACIGNHCSKALLMINQSAHIFESF